MTKDNFKIKLNNLLNNVGVDRQVVKITAVGVNIALHFNGIDMKTLVWLNKRFHYGIHMVEGENNVVYINSPLEKKIELSLIN